MCGCEPGFLCSRCRGVTIDDDRHLDDLDADEPMPRFDGAEWEDAEAAA